MAHSTSQRNCRHGLLILLLLALMLFDTIDGQFNLGQLGQQFGLGNLGGMLGGLMGGGHQQQQQPQQLQRHPNIEDRPSQGGPGPGQGPGGGNNPVGGLNVGGQVEGILNRIGLNQQFTHQLSGLINGVAANFFAPNPNSPIPPHVQRRIMRFCTRHPEFPKCQGHPEWVLQQGNVPTAPQMGNAQDTLNLNEMFPNLIPFQIPPIPQMAVRNFLAGVPDLLKQFVPPQVVGQITEFARQALTSICNQRDCLKQLPEFLNQRATVAEQEAAITRTLAPGKSVEQVDHDVELRLARTFQVKKALIRKAGLEGKVEPANNGVFQQDLLLTEEQANSILTEVNQNQVGVGVAPTGGRLKRAGNSLYLESAPNQRWPTGQPISFMFDRSVSSEVDKSAVRAALNEIQAKMGGCLRFQEANTKPAGSHLYYVKVANPVFCGLSYVGRIEPANPIYLSFMCGNPMGVAIHETLHALGLQHEQLRIDRDKFITVNWENVNPQQYDFFAVSDMTKFSSYGLKYDYGSIMHYSSTIASQNFGKKTMTAKQNPAANDAMMGQRNALSQSDIEMLKRMYCMPTCKDNNVYCGVWATSDLCRTANGAAQGWMVQNCRKSCGFCTVGTS